MFKECSQNFEFMWEGPQGGHVATPLQEEVGESNLVQVHGSSNFVLGGIRIGMGYMNLVTVIT